MGKNKSIIIQNSAPVHIGYDIVISEVAPKSKVLDLGCGDGALLLELQENKEIQGSGVEISEMGVSKCLEKGLYCFQGDIDDGLTDYPDDSFDYVILNQTLQSTKKPYHVIKEVMRIGKNAIISFPNFGYFKTRCQLMVKGRMPQNKLIPYEWYNSPNYHHLTIKDFIIFCRENSYPVKKSVHFSLNKMGKTRIVRKCSNVYAQYGLFILDGEEFTKRGLSYNI